MKDSLKKFVEGFSAESLFSGLRVILCAASPKTGDTAGKIKISV